MKYQSRIRNYTAPNMFSRPNRTHGRPQKKGILKIDEARINKLLTLCKKTRVFVFETDGGWKYIGEHSDTGRGRIEGLMKRLPSSLVGIYLINHKHSAQSVTDALIDDLGYIGALR